MSLLVKTNKAGLLFFFYLLSQFGFSQNFGRNEIHGVIRVDSTLVEGVNVVNENTKKSTSSDKSGNFVVFLKEGDVLVFSAVNLVTLRKKIVRSDLNESILIAHLQSERIPLKEVEIQQDSHFTAESMGVLSKPAKKYTVAERRLYTARSGLLDRPLNWMSGRTARLKKELIVSEKEQLMANIEYLFEENFYTEILKIPKDYIGDFKLYCIANNDFVNSVKSKNNTLTKFYFLALAKDYNKITVYEN